MNLKDFENSSAGECIKTSRGYWTFIPNPLPPHIDYNMELICLLSDADRLLGELSGTGRKPLKGSSLRLTLIIL